MYQATITRQFTASHALRLYDGTLEPTHGHNWKIQITVATDQLDEIEVVIDFHQLEAIADEVLGRLDGGDLNRLQPFVSEHGSQLKINPSAERVAWYIATQIRQQLPETVNLSCVSVEESPGCIAIWRAD